MTHPQNSPRGLFSKVQAEIGGQTLKAPACTYMQLSAGLSLSGKETNFMTQNSTGVVFPQQIRVANKRYINANSTAFILTAASAKPATDNGAAFTIISNSTGVALAINSTGATWKWLQVTSVQPT